jgi:hypothetical protein
MNLTTRLNVHLVLMFKLCVNLLYYKHSLPADWSSGMQLLLLLTSRYASHSHFRKNVS